MNNLLPIAVEYHDKCRGFHQISIYPDIGPEILTTVKENFPEFDISTETPLLFFQDADKYYQIPKWVMITNLNIYYSMYYIPYQFRVINVHSLHNINQFQVVKRIWPLDSYIAINNKKVFSVYIKDKEQVLILQSFVNELLSRVETKVVIERTSKDLGYVDLENEHLFTIAEDFFKETNIGGKIWSFECFYYGPYIPSEKLDEAAKEYAKYDSVKEKPIVYVDTSWNGTFSSIDFSGFVITNQNLYYKLPQKITEKDFVIGKIPLCKINSFRIKMRFFTQLVINNGQYKFLLTGFTLFNRRDSTTLEQLMKKFVKYLSKPE